ncbi:hypothetical protein J6590_098117, partial [Homalodisca vitripennis]
HLLQLTFTLGKRQLPKRRRPVMFTAATMFTVHRSFCATFLYQVASNTGNIV